MSTDVRAPEEIDRLDPRHRAHAPRITTIHTAPHIRRCAICSQEWPCATYDKERAR